MRIATTSALAISALLLLSCTSGATSAPGKCAAETRALQKSPEKEAQAAVHSGAPYLLAVQGYTIELPGVENNADALRIGYRILPGTTDAIEDESCSIYQERAREYAARFNRKVIELTSAR
jgi:hypothetical protein